MSKGWLIGTLLLMSCFTSNNNWQELDLKAFSISIPKQWHYQKERGVDSFVGDIAGPKVNLYFDYSTMGYASHLEDFSTEENIQIDSTNKFITKIIWPKISGKGITGIYIHSRNSSLNFQMNGENLSSKDQKLALQVFKSIKLKDK